MQRVPLRIWAGGAATSEVVNPDLDAEHPGGQGGSNKNLRGWIVEKEPHQWANWLYQTTTGFWYEVARFGVPKLDADESLRPKFRQGAVLGGDGDGLLVWVNDAVKAQRSFGSYSEREVKDLKAFWTSQLDAHKGNTSNPHNDTPALIGVLPNTGGRFTGRVSYNGGINFGNAHFEKINENVTAFYRPSINKGFAGALELANMEAVACAYLGDGVASRLYEEGSTLERDLEVERLFVTPMWDAYWPLIGNPYSMNGKGNLTILGGDGLPKFNKFGMLLEAGKSYILDDLSLLEYQGCVLAIVDGKGVTIKRPTGSLDLARVFGVGKSVSFLHIWGYQLTDQQLSNKLASIK